MAKIKVQQAVDRLANAIANDVVPIKQSANDNGKIIGIENGRIAAVPKPAGSDVSNLANTDLSNLTPKGEIKFDNKINSAVGDRFVTKNQAQSDNGKVLSIVNGIVTPIVNTSTTDTSSLANKDLSNLTIAGESKLDSKVANLANRDLSNLTANGETKIDDKITSAINSKAVLIDRSFADNDKILGIVNQKVVAVDKPKEPTPVDTTSFANKDLSNLSQTGSKKVLSQTDFSSDFTDPLGGRLSLSDNTLTIAGNGTNKSNSLIFTGSYVSTYDRIVALDPTNKGSLSTDKVVADYVALNFVSKKQTTADSGKFLGINSSGNVVPVGAPTGGGTPIDTSNLANTDLSNLTAVGGAKYVAVDRVATENDKILGIVNQKVVAIDKPTPAAPIDTSAFADKSLSNLTSDGNVRVFDTPREPNTRQLTIDNPISGSGFYTFYNNGIILNDGTSSNGATLSFSGNNLYTGRNLYKTILNPTDARIIATDGVVADYVKSNYFPNYAPNGTLIGSYPIVDSSGKIVFASPPETKFVAKQQTTADSGKYLGINSSGQVVPLALPTASSATDISISGTMTAQNMSDILTAFRNKKQPYANTATGTASIIYTDASNFSVIIGNKITAVKTGDTLSSVGLVNVRWSA